MKYLDSIVTYTNDTSQEKYEGVDWAAGEEEQCPCYVSRLKIEFSIHHYAPTEGSQYEEVKCRRKKNHKGACLNNKPYGWRIL